MKRKELLKLFADTETSYINAEQLKLPPKERERYACCYGIISADGTIQKFIADGKNTTMKFVEYLVQLAKEHKDKQIVVYFHNLKYDWTYIMYKLNTLGYTDVKKLHSYSCDEFNDGLAIYKTSISFNYRSKGKDKNGNTTFRSYTITFYDSYKMYPFSVAKMGEFLSKTFGIELNKKSFDYNKIRDYNYKFTDEEVDYVLTDIKIPQTFHNVVPDTINLKSTIASNAFASYVSEFMPKVITDGLGNTVDMSGYKDRFKFLFPNEFTFRTDTGYKHTTYTRLGTIKGKFVSEIDMVQVNDYINNHYYGGITQVNPKYRGKMIIYENRKDKNELIAKCKKYNRDYIIVKGKERILDVNSLYPYSMVANKLPYGVPVVIEYPSYKELYNMKDTHAIFLEIENIYGKCKKDRLPIIPKNKFQRMNLTNVYYETLDNVRYGTTLREWELIKEHYEIVHHQIVKAYVFQCSDDIFKDYILFHTNGKVNASKNKDEVNKQVHKLLQNSLYGKWAESADKKSYIKMYDTENNTWIKKEKPSKKGEYRFPVISAFITSYARCYIISLIDKLDLENFVYMDTDSIHFIEDIENGKDLKMFEDLCLIDDAELGKLKLENSSDLSIYLAPKKYGFIDKQLEIKCAGLPEDCKQNITDIFDFYYGYSTNSKLQQLYIKGGIDLVEVKYEIKGSNTKYELYLADTIYI